MQLEKPVKTSKTVLQMLELMPKYMQDKVYWSARNLPYRDFRDIVLEFYSVWRRREKQL